MPPQEPPSFEETIVERLVECGLRRDGLSAHYDDTLQETIVVLGENAGVSSDDFECVRAETRSASLEFQDEGLGQAYRQYVAEQERPRRLAESRQRLQAEGLLQGFPRRDQFEDFSAYLLSLERHAGLAEGRWLSAVGDVVTFHPPEQASGDDTTQHYEQAARLLSLIYYASLIGDLPHFGFVGNERVAQD